MAVPHSCLLLCLALLPLAVAAKPTVKVPGLGVVNGMMDPDHEGIALFKGIPYAEAPVKKLRWQPPVPHRPWAAPRDATHFGAACMGALRGIETRLDALSLQMKTSEDCLFLNVAAPSKSLRSRKKLPVMVWIHGGAYTAGTGAIYPLSALVESSGLSMVVVSINYRLNAFGFLGSSSLKARGGSTGNFGTQDQQLALAWVHKHIGAFGGDSSAVTVFGESAGGNSVMQHLVRPSSFGLYSKAIVESGSYHIAQSLEEAEVLFKEILEATGCSGVDCLRSKKAEDIEKVVTAAMTWGPVIDGVALKESPYETIARGRHNTKVPVLIGSNSDEAAMLILGIKTLSLPVYPKGMTEKEFDAAIHDFPGRGHIDLEKVKELYSPHNYNYPQDLGDFSQWWWMAMRIMTDRIGSGMGLGYCGVRLVARDLVARNPAVYTYLFTHPTQATVPGILGTGPGSVVVPHESEISYVFGDASQMKADHDASKIARTMSGYWTNFAATGNPNGGSLPPWPVHDPKVDSSQRLDLNVGTEKGLRKDACDYWEKHIPKKDFLVV